MNDLGPLLRSRTGPSAPGIGERGSSATPRPRSPRPTTMNLTLAYRGRSAVVRGPSGLAVTLEPNLRRDRVGYEGVLRHPIRFREAIGALARRRRQRPPLSPPRRLGLRGLPGVRAPARGGAASRSPSRKPARRSRRAFPNCRSPTRLSWKRITTDSVNATGTPASGIPTISPATTPISGACSCRATRSSPWRPTSSSSNASAPTRAATAA